MTHRLTWLPTALLVSSLLTANVVRADLVAAQKAYAAQDYPRAFRLFSEIAEIGNLTGQENLAAMYVDGQGVKRDNTLGFAWATIARENGGGAPMQNIIDQLTPRLSDAARARVAEVTGKFGSAALRERLLPTPDREEIKGGGNAPCKMRRPVDPDAYYPPAAARAGISGSVLVEVTLGADQHVHRPRVLYSVPENVLDEAGRAVALMSGYVAPSGPDGAPLPCTMRYKVRFRSPDSTTDAAITRAYENSRPIAESGDPVAQMVYGLLMFDRERANTREDQPFTWFLKAAQAGVPKAQYLVGVSLLRSDLPSTDVRNRKSRAWLDLAANGGDWDAKVLLAEDALNGEEPAPSQARALAWLDEAATPDHRDGSVLLAAWFATHPDPARRNPQRSLDVLAAMPFVFDADPLPFEIRAAANAQLGNFDAAKSLQKSAILRARQLGWDTNAQAARLTVYERKNAWTGNLMRP
ncbi:MAG TPA: TonB family protein [Steroidobacteraceae bacterium]|nr:TonB family protein [Steroidobacteraceae bacterium]